VRYFLGDVQGSTRLLSDATGAITSSYDYSAFGETLSTNAETAYLYAGQQYDAATEMYSLRARYYAPGAGRFVSRDVWPVDYGDPWELNRYGYTAGNPVRWTDPSGLFADTGLTLKQSVAQNAAIGALGGWLVGTTVSVASAFLTLGGGCSPVTKARFDANRAHIGQYISIGSAIGVAAGAAAGAAFGALAYATPAGASALTKVSAIIALWGLPIAFQQTQLQVLVDQSEGNAGMCTWLNFLVYVGFTLFGLGQLKPNSGPGRPPCTTCDDGNGGGVGGGDDGNGGVGGGGNDATGNGNGNGTTARRPADSLDDFLTQEELGQPTQINPGGTGLPKDIQVPPSCSIPVACTEFAFNFTLQAPARGVFMRLFGIRGRPGETLTSTLRDIPLSDPGGDSRAFHFFVEVDGMVWDNFTNYGSGPEGGLPIPLDAYKASILGAETVISVPFGPDFYPPDLAGFFRDMRGFLTNP
jgi:RHS repeat-associated protein